MFIIRWESHSSLGWGLKNFGAGLEKCWPQKNLIAWRQHIMLVESKFLSPRSHDIHIKIPNKTIVKDTLRKVKSRYTLNFIVKLILIIFTIIANFLYKNFKSINKNSSERNVFYPLYAKQIINVPLSRNLN